jgi:hypothetical protein
MHNCSAGGAQIGVVNSSSLAGTDMAGLRFPQGENGYQIRARGVDGFTFVCFDAVNYSAPAAVTVSVQAYVAQSGWHEGKDRLRAWAETGNGQVSERVPACEIQHPVYTTCMCYRLTGRVCAYMYIYNISTPVPARGRW